MQDSEKWLNNQRINLMKKAIYYISIDPLRYGNCQFPFIVS